MKPETEERLAQGYYRVFYKKEGRRFILSSRHDIPPDELELRIIEVRMAKQLGLFLLLPEKQQTVLNFLYPENLKLPRKIDAVRELRYSFKTVARLEREGFGNLEKLFELGPEGLIPSNANI